MTRSRGFWNFMAKRYSRQAIADPEAYERKLELTRALFKPDSQVFEFGCGTGSTALAHAPHVAQIDAIDYSDAMIEIARGKAQDQAIDNVSFQVSAIEDWQAGPGTYDVVMGHSILHLLPDPDAAIAQARALLKPGGYFVSSTVCGGEMPGIARAVLPIVGALRLIPYLSLFTGDELVGKLTRAGFEIEHEWRPRPQGSIFIIARAV